MTDFAAIDFETANGQHSSVCSVGVVVVRGGVITDTFYSLIHSEPDHQFLCTCQASRRRFGRRLPNQQLHTVAEACGCPMTNHHHALADAEACARIAMEIL